MGVIRSKESEIDEIAKSVLQELLPPAWVRNTHRQDYAIDSTVELCEALDNGPKVVTGVEFLIQLKGKEKPERRKGSISVRLDRVDLEYYVDRKRPPVFLVVVDTKVREGYWLFLQGYALEKNACLNVGGSKRP